MTTQQPPKKLDIYTRVVVETEMSQGCVISKALIKFDNEEGMMEEQIVWHVIYNSCRHLARMTHVQFYTHTLKVEEAIRSESWQRLQCEFACPLDIELVHYYGRKPSIVRL